MEEVDENKRVLPRIVYLFKRLSDRWAVKNLPLITDVNFNTTYFPYFMSIGKNGISNHELVKRIKVTKQGVSKTVKELEHLGLVYAEKDEHDARSIMIYLSAEGNVLYDQIKVSAVGLEETYRKVVGNKNYENMIDSMLKLMDYHEALEIEEGN